jgi:hypothetical protein
VPGDPPADCATRPPAKITVSSSDGTTLRDVDAGLLVTQGFHGGEHIWIGVACENLGPNVLVEPTVRDENGKVISEPDLYALFDLTTYQDPDGGAPVVHVQGRFAPGVYGSDLMGKKVTLGAKVTDACPHSASGQASGIVTGFDQDP